MDKEAVLRAIRQVLLEQESRVEAASRSNAEAATDEQNKAEDKYDTRGLEASYLAHGQARMAVEIREQLAAFGALGALDAAPSTISVGSLVRLEVRQRSVFYFVGPAAGGLEVDIDGHRVTVVTPSSPLGRLLVGKGEGTGFSFPPGPAGRAHRIVAFE